MTTETERKILTLGNKSEEMRQKTMKDKWFKMQEKLTDQAVVLVNQNQDTKDILISIKLLGEILKMTK